MTPTEAMARLEKALKRAKRAGVSVDDVRSAVDDRFEGVPCPCESSCRLCSYTGRVSPEVEHRYREMYPG